MVTVSGSGDPVTGTTAGGGYVSFDLPDGSYTYNVTAPEGYLGTSGSFTAPAAETVHVALDAVVSGPTALYVTLQDSEGNPVSSVTAGDSVKIIGAYDVTSYDDTLSYWYELTGSNNWVQIGSSGTVSGSGYWTFGTTGLSAGTYTIKVTDTGSLDGTAELIVAEPVAGTPPDVTNFMGMYDPGNNWLSLSWDALSDPDVTYSITSDVGHEWAGLAYYESSILNFNPIELDVTITFILIVYKNGVAFDGVTTQVEVFGPPQ